MPDFKYEITEEVFCSLMFLGMVKDNHKRLPPYLCFSSLMFLGMVKGTGKKGHNQAVLMPFLLSKSKQRKLFYGCILFILVQSS